MDALLEMEKKEKEEAGLTNKATGHTSLANRAQRLSMWSKSNK